MKEEREYKGWQLCRFYGDRIKASEITIADVPKLWKTATEKR